MYEQCTAQDTAGQAGLHLTEEVRCVCISPASQETLGGFMEAM